MIQYQKYMASWINFCLLLPIFVPGIIKNLLLLILVKPSNYLHILNETPECKYFAFIFVNLFLDILYNICKMVLKLYIILYLGPMLYLRII